MKSTKLEQGFGSILRQRHDPWSHTCLKFFIRLTQKVCAQALLSLFSPSSEIFFNHHRVKTVQSDVMVTYRILTIRYSEISFIGSWVYSFWISYQCWTLANLRPHTSSSSVILQEYRITAWRLINIKFRTSAGFLLLTGVCRVPACAIKSTDLWPLTPFT